jgi:hypothetical protein
MLGPGSTWPTDRHSTNSACVSQRSRSTSSRWATAQHAAEALQRQPREGHEELARGEPARGQAWQGVAVGQRECTFSASGLTMLVGALLQKLTTLSKAAAKYSS